MLSGPGAIPVRLMVADSATRRSAEQAVMTRDVTGDTADNRAAGAPNRLGRDRRYHDQAEGRGRQ